MLRKPTSGIYWIRNIVNGKIYVGQTRDLKNRSRNHLFKLRSGKHENVRLQQDFKLFGESNFEIDLIRESSTDFLNMLEKHYIAKYRTLDPEYGYNQAEIIASPVGRSNCGVTNLLRVGKCTGKFIYVQALGNSANRLPVDDESLSSPAIELLWNIVQHGGWHTDGMVALEVDSYISGLVDVLLYKGYILVLPVSDAEIANMME